MLLVILVPVSLIVLYVLVSNQSRNAVCSDVDIKLNYKTEKPLLNETDLYRLLGLNKGKSELIGKPLKELKLNVYEQKLLKHNAIKRANVFLGVRGDLKIEIHQREPIIRVKPFGKKDYYLSEDKVHIPLSQNFTPDLIPVSCIMDSKVDNILCTLMSYVNNNTFWKEQIEQFFVSTNGDISFIPLFGNHEVILGDENDLEEKFKKLELFYRKGLSKIGWNKYKTVNLKYKEQVICK